MRGPIDLERVRDRIHAARSSPEGRRSVWSAIGLIGSSLAMMVTVFVLARRFGTATYGVYAGIGALVGLAATFGALGTKDVLLQRVTRDRSELASAWGVLLAANVVVGIPLMGLTIGAAAVLLPGRDLTAIALIAVAEYVSAGLLKAPAAAWVGLDRFALVAAVNVFDAVLRLLAAATLFAGDPQIRDFGVALVVVMAVGAAIVNVVLGRTAGRPRLVWSELIDGCRKGAPYSVATISTGIQSNIDQFMLVRARLDVDAGLYALGVRFIGYSMLPLHAVTSATIPEFFKLGHSGTARGLAYARRLAPSIAFAAVVAASIAIAVSTPLGSLFGDRFDDVVIVTAALGAFPLIRSMQTLIGTALLGSGYQQIVARAGVATAALNVVLNLVLIPSLGWWGAVVATYASELVSLAVLLLAARRLRRTSGSVPGPGIAAHA